MAPDYTAEGTLRAETFRTMLWDEQRSFELGIAFQEPGGVSGSGALRCTASGPERIPGVLLCLMGFADDGPSFWDDFRKLELRSSG